MPVSPPMRKVITNPIAKSMAEVHRTRPPHIVPIQLKILMPVGTAMSRLMMEKNGRSTTPVVNMWCAHTPSDSAAMVIVAKTMPL